MTEEGTKTDAAARKRAAVEMIARHEAALKRTARRYSFDAEDAEDAYQRALEIALTKAPTTDPRELIRWTQTVTKHEALAVRQSREKLLGYQPKRDGEEQDPVALLRARGDGPEALVERREDIARSREALQTLKPAERRALGLLGEGYSYAEIGEITGYSRTKINRLLAEGRAAFRGLVSRSEAGERCRDLQPLLSAFCDGEADPGDEATVREHLRACAYCRATVRAYRAAPRIAASMLPLLPLLPTSRSLLERTQELATSLWSRLPGGGGEAVATGTAAAGGSGAAGMAGVAKLLTVCAGAAGGAACVATGVVPAPLVTHQDSPPAVVRPAPQEIVEGAPAEEEPAAPAPVEAPNPEPEPAPEPVRQAEQDEAQAGAIEYEPPPPPAPVEAPSSPESASSGTAAGEFGP